MTAATLFRTIEAYSPTVLADEADTYFFEKVELRGVLNAGHMRSQAYVIRLIEPDFKPRQFRVWGPKAVALTGRLTGAWSTLADRSIAVQLERKKPDEHVELMRLDQLPAETEELRRRLALWAADFGPVFPELEAPELNFLNDRAADNWRPLLAIAFAVSDSFKTGSWLHRAQQAARLLSGKEEDDDIGVVLMDDLRELYAERMVAWLGSTEIVKALNELEDRPWADFAGGKGLTTTGLGNLLRPFGIKSRQRKQPTGKPLRGYYHSELEPVFSRYRATIQGKSPQEEEIADRAWVAGTTTRRYAGPEETDDRNAQEAPRDATRYKSATGQPDLISPAHNEINDTQAVSSRVAAKKQGSVEDTPMLPGEKDFVV